MTNAFAFACAAAMSDFDFAAMLFNETTEEPTMNLIITDDRRFRVTGKSTGFFGQPVFSVRRFGGRFGGDVGNRKRRHHERYDDTVEHNIRVRAEKRAAVQAIVTGLAEYEESRHRATVAASTHADRKGKRGNRRDDRLCGTEARYFDFGFEEPRRPRFDNLPVPEGMVRNSRTGHLVQVVVKSSERARRAKAMAAMVIGSRPRMTADDVRRSMGLASN